MKIHRGKQLLRRLAVVALLALFITYSALYKRIQMDTAPALVEFEELVAPSDIILKSTIPVTVKLPSQVNETWAPFVEVSSDKPKLIVLLSYQRCGSTLLAQLFNNNDNIFYQFEPLDSLYSSLYGTPYGWNVPSDITHYRDRSKRKLPETEVKEVSNFLRHILRCDVNSLPTETLVHPYQLRFRAQFHSDASYVNCLAAVTNVTSTCIPPMKGFCGSRFGEVPEKRLAECNQLMINANDKLSKAPGGVRNNFKKHKKCLREARQVVNKTCVHHLVNACQQRNIRAVKVVRATMRSMESLLASEPNLRVIHLIRDPRGVTLSRMNLNTSVRGLSCTNTSREETMVCEAQTYCQAVVTDIYERRVLERRYPGRILSVIYDHLVADLERYVSQIYQFLDLPQDGVQAGCAALRVKVTPGETNGTRKITNLSTKWRMQLTYDLRLRILDVCRSFFELGEYEWRI